MLQLKQPMTLTDKSVEECVNLYCGACVRWISELRQAEVSSRREYWISTLRVLAECRQIERSLSELPHIIIEMMSPQLTRKFADLIYDYDKTSYLKQSFWNQESRNSLCIAMFRSVLTPHIYKYDDEIASRSFTHDLVVQTLDCVPELRKLHLPLTNAKHDPAPLAGVIHHLTHLQIFTYNDHCTDEVIEQLGLHCTHLKKVSVCGSSRVTNASVQHLLQLQKLEFLNLSGTLIDKEHYVLLLSELPQIKNMVLREDDILDHVAENNVHKISHVSGYVQDISILAQRFRNITNLDIYKIPEDLSGLAALTTLRTLRLTRGHYARNNLRAVLTGIGPRLIDLNLILFKDVNFQDIVTLCPSLASLSMFKCTLLPLDPDTQLDPQLPHFRNLTSLRLICIYDRGRSCSYIQHYVSLKTIRLF
ncbi:hypothetical protein B7P43_G07664 [Cryptotermes secundus]|uniref:Uncharacterized protein n=1 Tax=Cryptotermes secundus TaxID=105785 RepID=A0A2J7RJQ0_9NEOP|nr:hypothetical protein B7P43_G07664 [Cryptotermes secundus]